MERRPGNAPGTGSWRAEWEGLEERFREKRSTEVAGDSISSSHGELSGKESDSQESMARETLRT